MRDHVKLGAREGGDTIAAIATAVGGAVAVVRISGPCAAEIAGGVWQGREPLRQAPFRVLRLGRIVAAEGEVDERALAVFMPAPHSYTGEDMVELQCHGGALSARLVLLALLRGGARHAEPGEFTRRAFLNGKMDLTQAEAVADLIQAHSEAALRLANRQLHGLLGRQIDSIHDRLSDLLAEIEARLDFTEENLDWASREHLEQGFSECGAAMARLLASQHDGEVLRDGVRVVIAGPPNVGKSSLLNAILGRDRAIVTPIPGTTRDTLEEFVQIRGIPVRLTDTAGIRATDDVIEKNGVERAVATARSAHVVLWVFDASLPYEAQRRSENEQGDNVILVANKADLLRGEGAGLPSEVCRTCALTGDGLEGLYAALERAVWEASDHREADVAVSARHAALLHEAGPLVDDACRCALANAWELAAVSLRGAIWAIGQINGRTATPDVLDRIFARFCIGK
ncbi:MAG: tRNA uridine-5-carboxymethylaminomethyl(34) synthesis GTPase MnmE [Lentisphaerae bacterium RIFOXYB12_FULL_65_16]|nr:MAG: tRNA uridine-5-carboxymethylaminomethyl(34) synthesis GTPase MnmE [Lentisphaerae bacterium RIFOXYA12_64_32]OGV89764.1 MAG: tRNA uridine-5-carboxymethylaminomethyl(34) synthesis GTPase MnmE [Lentisphaerae bacterium RIFOXYB12_FULL_65_16]